MLKNSPQSPAKIEEELLFDVIDKDSTRGNSRGTVFIAAPMSGFSNDDDYKKSRDSILELSRLIKNLGFNGVYYAGANISSNTEFDEHNLAQESDEIALRKAELFVMIYPEKILSSVLVEAGFARALEKPMLFLVKDKEDLPYVFRGIPEWSSEDNSKLEKDAQKPVMVVQKFTDLEDMLSQAVIAISGMIKIKLI
jgi:nucleoside 2-deoxyribosyltransferase